MKHSHFNRIISMFIAFAMLLTMVPAFAANPSQFVDFPTGWSKVAMSFSVDNGLLNGKSANKIEPASNLTRAEMATIINRAFGAEIKGYISSYTDVKTSDWFYTEMQKAVNMQTFQGDGNGKLRPNSAITREEVMTVIARAIVLETSDYSSIAKFKDYSLVSDWAKPYVAALISGGYVNGYEDGTVKPKANITREEFAQLMYNIFKTYLTVSGTTYNSVYKQSCVMINNKNINLSNVVVYGDLVLGDGVGTSQINLTNVTINGRLVARGGIITLKNVTTGGGVVVKNVNGTTHFNNYRTDAVFNGVVEHTYTTYLTPSFVTGGGNRPSGTVSSTYGVTVEYYYRNVTTGNYDIDDTKTIQTQLNNGSVYDIVSKLADGYKFSHGKYIANGREYDFSKEDFSLTISSQTVIRVFYDKYYTISIKHPDGTQINNVEFMYNTPFADIYKKAFDVDVPIIQYTTPDNYTFNIEWYLGGKWIKNTDVVNKSGTITYKPIAIIDYIDFGYVPEQDGFDNVHLTNRKSYADSDTYTYSFDDVIKNYPVKERKYYTFDGWTTQYGDITDINSVKFSPAQINAKWVAKTPDVEFDLGNIGAQFKNTYQVPTTYSCDVTFVLPVEGDIDFDNTKYTFEGWYDNAEFTGDAVTEIAAHTSNENKKYYAYFLPIDTTVTHTVKFYALPKDTKNSTFVGELEIVSGDKFGFAQDGYISDAIKQLYREADGTVQKIGYELWDESISSGQGVRNLVEAGYYDAAEGYQHYIRPDLVYHNGSKWVPFTGDTKVTKNMEVYAVKKQIEIYVDGSILGYKLPIGLTFGTPYNSSTRAVDSLKDAMYIAMYDVDSPTLKIALDRFEEIYGKTIEQVIFSKIAPKSKGLIDENGYLQNLEFSMLISDVISTQDVEKEIRKYIDGVFRGDDARLKEIIETIGVESLVRNIGIKSLVENIGYDEVRNALTASENRALLIKYIRQLLRDDKDFRDMLIEDRDFMQSILENMQDEVIDTIVGDPDFIIDILNSSQELKELFIDSAMGNNSFLRNVLTTHKDEIIYLIHHEEKQELLDLLDNDSVKNEIVTLLKNDEDFMNHLDNDQEFKDFVVNAIHDSVNLADMFDDDTIDAMLAELEGNADFEQFKKDIISDVNTDSFKREIIESVKSNVTVIEAIVSELSANDSFKKTLINNLSGNADLRTKLVEAAIGNDATKKQIVEKIASEASFKKEILSKISSDIASFSKEIVNNIKSESSFKSTVIDSVIIIEAGAPVRNDAFNNMITVLKDNAEVISYTKEKAQAIINAEVPVNTPAITDDEAKEIINAYINESYNVNVGGYDVDVSAIESDIDAYFVNIASDYESYVSGFGPFVTPLEVLESVDSHIGDVVEAYLDGSDATLASDIEKYVEDIVDAYNDDDTDHSMEAQIDDYIVDAVDAYVSGNGGNYADTIDNYIADIKNSYNPAATDGIDGKINEYIESAINEYVSGASSDFADDIDSYINDALANFDAADTTGVNGVINSNINSIINGYINNTDTTYKTYIDNYINGIITDFVDGNVINDDIKSYIDSHMRDFVRDSIEKYSNDDPTLNADVYNYIDEKLPEFLFNHIKDYFHGTLTNDALESAVENVIIDFVKKYINEDPSLTNEIVIQLIEGNMVDYIISQLTSTDENQLPKVKEFVEHTKSNFATKLKEEDISKYSDLIKEYIETNADSVKTIVSDNYSKIVDFVLDNVTDADINKYLHDIIIEKANTLEDSLINSFIDGNINDILSDDFIKNYIDTHENDEELINMVLNYLTSDKIVEYINVIEQKDKDNNTNELGKFIDKAVDVFKDMDFYKSLIKCLDTKAPTYKVTNENIYFMVAIGEAIGERSFEDALKLLGEGAVSDALIKLNDLTDGDISDMYYQAVQSFSKGIEEIELKIEADSAYTEDYPMSLWVEVDFASIIAKYYTKLYDKLVQKIEDVAPYYYTENQYLKQFVEGFKFDEYFEYNAAVVTEENSGYKFKSIMEYYDLLYNNLLLVDKAVLWYGPNTPEELENLRDDIANDIIKAFNKLQSLLEGLDEDGLIFGSYTIKDVIARVESLKKLGAQVPALTTVIDNVCTILSKVEGGEVIAGGYTVDELAKLSDRLESAVATLRDEEYEKLNSELEDIINKAISKADEIINELDENGTILGKVSLDELMSKVDVVNNIYKKLEGKLDAVIGKLADIEAGSVSGKFDTKYWEDVLFGKDDYNRFDLDDILDAAAPHLGKIRVDNPYTDDNKRLVIDEYKVNGGSATATFDRYMN